MSTITQLDSWIWRINCNDCDSRTLLIQELNNHGLPQGHDPVICPICGLDIKEEKEREQ